MMSPLAAFPATNDASTIHCSPNWHLENAYQCQIGLTEEEDGTFSAIVLNLPGAGSCGSTEDEALCNVKEAVEGVIESHRDAGEEIPWRQVFNCDIPAGARLKWIFVNA